MEIKFERCAGCEYAYVKTKKGLDAFIQKAQTTRGCKEYFSIYIKGDKRNVATRATLEKVMEILESR